MVKKDLFSYGLSQFDLRLNSANRRLTKGRFGSKGFRTDLTLDFVFSFNQCIFNRFTFFGKPLTRSRMTPRAFESRVKVIGLFWTR